MISYVIELTINDGGLDTFKELAAGYATAVEENEPSTTTYQWYLAEDDGKFLFMSGADKQQRWPGALNGIFIEEFDAAKGDSAGAAGPFFNVFAVQKITS